MRKGLGNLQGPVGQRTARGFGWRRPEALLGKRKIGWQQIQAPVGLVLSCVGAKARWPMTRDQGRQEDGRWAAGRDAEDVEDALVDLAGGGWAVWLGWLGLAGLGSGLEAGEALHGVGAENQNAGDQPGWKDEKKTPEGPALTKRRREGIGRGRCVKTIKSTRCRGDKTQTQTQQPAASGPTRAGNRALGPEMERETTQLCPDGAETCREASVAPGRRQSRLTEFGVALRSVSGRCRGASSSVEAVCFVRSSLLRVCLCMSYLDLPVCSSSGRAAATSACDSATLRLPQPVAGPICAAAHALRKHPASFHITQTHVSSPRIKFLLAHEPWHCPPLVAPLRRLVLVGCQQTLCLRTTSCCGETVRVYLQIRPSAVLACGSVLLNRDHDTDF
ncbi:hypothetical protein BKA56DRAFT_650453 [Ilyonectria sp. MPI-CAGE-AT-0026]|nr:hypothetical protein BKA56DRAFT_650453 [Ilyonectria sp. MPI-CAGE-AT-0026]